MLWINQTSPLRQVLFLLSSIHITKQRTPKFTGKTTQHDSGFGGIDHVHEAAQQE